MTQTRIPIFLLLLTICLWQLTPAYGDINKLQLDHAAGPQLLFQSADQAYFEAATMSRTDVEIKVTGLLARVTLIQHFRNDTDRFVEAVYALPLPPGTALNSMIMDIGNRRIIGEIKEKSEAKHIYKTAKAAGFKASILRQKRPNMFTQNIANIAPGETITIRLGFIQTINYEAEIFSLRLPLTITPRYDDSLQTAVNASITSTPTIDNKSLMGEVYISGTVDFGLPIIALSSANHSLATYELQRIWHFELTSASPANQDFILSWQTGLSPDPQAAYFTESYGGEHYGLLMLVPPRLQDDETANRQAMAKEMIYIIDTSGSMGGQSIKQAKVSLQAALNHLNPNDLFNIIEFNEAYRQVFSQSRLAGTDAIDAARNWVDDLSAGGGTNMIDVLDMALSLSHSPAYIRQIIFITDGAIDDEMALFQLIQSKLGNTHLSTVGIGAAPNNHFMRRAAEFGRGSTVSINNEHQLVAQMSRLFERLSYPMAKDLQVHWPAAMHDEIYPKRLPNLHRGEALMISAKLRDTKGNLSISGISADQPWRLNFIGSDGTAPLDFAPNGIASIWAARKIKHLSDRILSGTPVSIIKPQIIEVALKHQLLSGYTSFVAVEEIISRHAGEDIASLKIDNMIPKGQASTRLSYPGTATMAQTHIAIAITLACLGLLVLTWQGLARQGRTA